MGEGKEIGNRLIRRTYTKEATVVGLAPMQTTHLLSQELSYRQADRADSEPYSCVHDTPAFC